ncbi:cellulose binding domain-containing protein [Micromonospora sp. NPDC049044]|uniref:cellulose binding domain-containing protein n=1 Tax=Micromonospora sp. NPDC049044 TaxID=3154827 RepID=UPI0033F10F12
MTGVCSSSLFRRLRPGPLAVVVVSAAVLATALATVPMAAAGTVAYPGIAPTPGGAPAAVAAPNATTPPTVPSTPGTSPFPPSAPTNLAASEVRSGSVTLTWTAATPGCCAITGYDITYYQVLDDVVYTASVGAVTTTTITGYFRPGLEYLFRMTARDTLGHRSTSTATLTVVIPVTDTPSPSTCRVTYRNQSEWPGGFVATLTVENVGAAPIDGWTVTFGFPGDQQITSGWNATLNQTGATVTAGNVDWNRALAPNGSASFGVQGRWSASAAPPTSFSLNGAACTVG